MKVIRKIIGSTIALAIPTVLTKVWIDIYGWIYFTPQGQLRGVDLIGPQFTIFGLFILWMFCGVFAVGNFLVKDKDDKHKKDS